MTMSDPECVMCGGSQHSWQRTHIELLRAEVENLRSQLSARDAEVRALQFDQRDLVALVGRLCRALPQDDDRRIQAMGYLTRKNVLGSVLRALTCEPGPGGEG